MFFFINESPLSPISFCSLFPSPGRFGSCAFSGRLWSRFGRLVYALLFLSPPSAGLGPFPSASSFFPCPFMVCPLWARCVVCVFSFLSFLCSPLGFRLSSFHLIFIVISPSSLLIFTCISLCIFTPCLGTVCVCV